MSSIIRIRKEKECSWTRILHWESTVRNAANPIWLAAAHLSSTIPLATVTLRKHPATKNPAPRKWSEVMKKYLVLCLFFLSSFGATAQAQIRAYVINEFSNTVSVIDTATNTVVATITIGTAVPFGVAITPDGTRAYVTHVGDNTVSVIDTATTTVVATIPVGAVPVGLVPEGVAITPDGTRAYVTNALDNIVSVIDTATNTVVATISVAVAPVGVAITPDGTRAYVTNAGDTTVSVIDTATSTVVATIPVGAVPFGVAITPDGTRAYVTNSGDTTVSVIDTATSTVVATIPVGAVPLGVAITPAPQAPKSKEECKHGGYLKFGPPAGPFKNQGQCVSYVEHH